MRVSDRVAVVTGAAGGIGGAIVRELVASGARTVVATDLSQTGVDSLAREFGGKVVAHSLDVANESATRGLVADIESSIGPVDLWFANAGVANGAIDASNDVWALQWNINVMAHVYAARALLPGWIARGEGHLITTASLAGLLTTLGDGAYSATKHAAVGYAEWLAITYGDKGVNVSCVCPGAVDTAMLRGAGGQHDNAAAASAAIGGGEVIDPSTAAMRIVEGVEADRFLIYTHDGFKELVVRKFDDTERWVRGMRKLWARSPISQ